MHRALAIYIAPIIALASFSPAGAAQSSNQCADYLIPLMEQAGLDPQLHGPAMGCDFVSGKWDDRTIHDSRAAVSTIGFSTTGRNLVLNVLAMSTSENFYYSVRFDRQTSEILTIGPGGVEDRSSISDYLVTSGPNWLNNLSQLYAADMERYLLNLGSEDTDLVDYLRWYMSRRDSILQSMSRSQNPTASAAFLANWGYQQWPWPWQLLDPVTIETYAAQQPSGAPTLVPSPTVTANSSSTGETRTFAVGVYDCRSGVCIALSMVKVNYKSVDGSLSGSCVTEPVNTPNGQTAWCLYEYVPGKATRLTVDESTLPGILKVISGNPQTYLVPQNPDGPLGPAFFEVGL